MLMFTQPLQYANEKAHQARQWYLIHTTNIYNFSPASSFFFPYLTHMLVSFPL